jgi:acetylglutamate kinase
MEKLYVIKIGGNIVDDEAKLSSFLKDFAQLQGKKILVHGGGKLATQMVAQLNIPQQMIDGRRITDEATLRVVTMVYAGLINKNIVSALQANGCNAIGLSGADGNAILAHKRIRSNIDYGFAGDVDEVNIDLMSSLLNAGLTLVMAPITHDAKGQLLNTNADTIAQEIGRALAKQYAVQLISSFEKSGVLMNANDDSTLIASMTPDYYADLKKKEVIFAGMIPKLDNAFRALQEGVDTVIIGKAEELPALINGNASTTLKHE